MMTLINVWCYYRPAKRLTKIVLILPCWCWTTIKLLSSLTIFILYQLRWPHIWPIYCLPVNILVSLVLVISARSWCNWWIYWVLIDTLVLDLFWCWSRSTCSRSWLCFHSCLLWFFSRTWRYIRYYSVHRTLIDFCWIQSLLSNRSILFILLWSIFTN